MRLILWRSIWVIVGTLVAYAALLWLLSEPLDIEVSVTSIGWTGAWLVGLVFGTGSTADSWQDLRAVEKSKGIPQRTLIGAQWMARNDGFKALASLFMTLAGFSSILRLGPVQVPTSLLFLGAVAIIVSMVFNRIDRERLEHSS